MRRDRLRFQAAGSLFARGLLANGGSPITPEFGSEEFTLCGKARGGLAAAWSRTGRQGPRQGRAGPVQALVEIGGVGVGQSGTDQPVGGFSACRVEHHHRRCKGHAPASHHSVVAALRAVELGDRSRRPQVELHHALPLLALQRQRMRSADSLAEREVGQPGRLTSATRGSARCAEAAAASGSDAGRGSALF